MKFSQLPSRIKLMIWLMLLCFASSLMLFTYGFMLMQEKAHRTAIQPGINRALQIIRSFGQQASPRMWNSTKIGHGLGFLKVHKAASTSAQNVFLRYGWRRNMAFILPYEHNIYRYPNIISMNESLTEFNILPPPPGMKLEILCHHVLYNRTAWNKVLPAHAPKIGTIREPFAVFQSTLRYFRPPAVLSIRSKNPVRTFLRDPYRYDDKDIRWSMLNNRMAQEYGVDTSVIQQRDFARFERYLQEVLDKDFAIVIVAEMFDESLVLIKRILDWTLNDILYMPKNQRVHVRSRYDASWNFSPEEEIRNLHKRFATFDYILYGFFKKKLDLQIAKESRFSEEVKHFKNVRQQVSDFCFSSGVLNFLSRGLPESVDRDHSTILTVGASEWNEAFEISSDDCFIMHVDEIDFTQAIRKRQYGEATWSW